jgi:hypothetical protein
VLKITKRQIKHSNWQDYELHMQIFVNDNHYCLNEQIKFECDRAIHHAGEIKPKQAHR